MPITAQAIGADLRRGDAGRTSCSCLGGVKRVNAGFGWTLINSAQNCEKPLSLPVYECFNVALR